MRLLATLLPAALAAAIPLTSYAIQLPAGDGDGCGPRSPPNCESLSELTRSIGPQRACDTCVVPVSATTTMPAANPAASCKQAPGGSATVGCAAPPLDHFSIP